MYSKLGGAALGGVLVALSLPPWGWWPLAFVGISVLSLLLREQPVWRRFRAGFAFGLGMFIVGLWWMGEFNIAGACLAVVVEALFMGIAGAVCPPGRGRTFGFPAALVLAEALRRVVPFGGLPLAGIALGQVGGPLAGAARLGGELLLVALVGIGGVAVAELVGLDRRDQDAEPAGGDRPMAREQDGEAAQPVPSGERVPAGAVGEPGRSNGPGPGVPIKRIPHLWPRPGVAVALVAGVALAGAAAPDGSAGESIDVGAVQGGGPRGFRGVDTDTGVVFGAQVAASERLRPPLDLVLWPEDVIDVDRPIGSTPEAERVGLVARRVGAPVVAGVVEDAGATRFRNATVVWSAAGTITDRYDKVHRVPFGEYVPWRGLVDRFADLSVIPRDAIAGRGPGVVSTSAGEMGVLISSEVFFAGRARAATGAGGSVLLVPTNAASFSTTQVPTQEVAAARLRAIESGRAVVQAAPTGYSAFIDHRGRVLARSTLGRRQVLQRPVTLRSGQTIYHRTGEWPLLALVAIALAGGWWARPQQELRHLP
ncbi:MAG TPA: apolipoprotein N-acyltransferase [Acidimicrobiales bacterium]|nr:apolipoprotein N-acyltransferase [Acidimicrobiales bacterium]